MLSTYIPPVTTATISAPSADWTSFIDSMSPIRTEPVDTGHMLDAAPCWALGECVALPLELLLLAASVFATETVVTASTKLLQPSTYLFSLAVAVPTIDKFASRSPSRSTSVTVTVTVVVVLAVVLAVALAVAEVGPRPPCRELLTLCEQAEP